MTASVIDVRGLQVAFGRRTVVDDVSFSIAPGRTLGLVGESGSGKSVTSLAIMRLVEAGGGRIAGGAIRLVTRTGERDLAGLSERAMRPVRGADVAMVFQDPMSSLDPVWSIGAQLVETIRQHQTIGRAEAEALAVESLRLAGIPSPEIRMRDYPHQFSGGMRQRVGIAIALSCKPAVLVADEPTTALDVTIQAQILALLAKLQQELGMAVLFITHNLAVVAEIADDVAVMYAGQIVEKAPVNALFARPRHPYTAGLLGSIPRPDSGVRRLQAIGGAPPAVTDMPQGCRFAPRCPHAAAICRSGAPALQTVAPDHETRCLRHAEIMP